MSNKELETDRFRLGFHEKILALGRKREERFETGAFVIPKEPRILFRVLLRWVFVNI